jgi:hypothetical protein
MKKKTVLSLILLCSFIISSIQLEFLNVYGQVEPIIIDGFFEDWDNVLTFLSDPMNDLGIIAPEEDISSCKITRRRLAENESPLPTDRVFFLYNHFNNVVEGTGTIIVYSIWLDTMPNAGDPTMSGTDYVVTFSLDIVTGGGIFIIIGDALLNKYNESKADYDYVECEGLEAAYGPGPDSGLSIEFAVPLGCIGNPRCFDVFFLTFAVGADYAPNMEGQIVKKTYCPPTTSPVGGELLPSTVSTVGTLLIAGISTIAISIGFAFKKRKII